MTRFLLLIAIISYFILVHNESVILTADSFDSHVNSHKISLVNFYVDWCMFCKLLSPIYDNVANEISKLDNDIFIGKVNCEQDLVVTTKFFIRKFPTLKLFKDGKPTNIEYVGERSVAAIVQFLTEIYYNGPQNITESVFNLRERPSFSINIDSQSHRFFQRFVDLGDEYNLECKFFRIIGEPVLENPVVKFTDLHIKSEVYQGDLYGDELPSWINERCRPLVKEITFSNAEQITEVSSALLIMFYDSNDLTAVDEFKKLMTRYKQKFEGIARPVIADAIVFSHALSHIGKFPRDVPIFVFDDFRHMYQLPSFTELSDERVFDKYIEHLKSGKLHTDFHNSDRNFGFHIKFEEKAVDPGSRRVELAKNEVVVVGAGEKDSSYTNTDDESNKNEHSGILGSIFKKLAPNNRRYTMLNFDDL